LTPADRRLPTDVLEAFREGCQAAWQRAAHVGRIARRPSAFAQGPAGRRVAGVRDAALATPFTTGVCRRRQAQVTHELAGGIHTGPSAPCGEAGDGHGALDATQGLEGLDHRGQPPRVHRRVACLCTTREACGGCGDGPNGCLEDAWLGWSRTDPCRAPPAVSRAPSGLARLATSLPEANGCEPILRAVRSRLASSRARRRSRLASAATWGTSTGGRAPERLRRAKWTASRRSVLTCSPAVFGSREGATTPPTSPCCVRSRSSPYPPGRLQRRRRGVGSARAASECAWRGHTDGCRCSREQPPRHRLRSRQRRQPSTLGAPPFRPKAC
jgi:hypothetical protein